MPKLKEIEIGSPSFCCITAASVGAGTPQSRQRGKGKIQYRNDQSASEILQPLWRHRQPKGRHNPGRMLDKWLPLTAPKAQRTLIARHGSSSKQRPLPVRCSALLASRKLVLSSPRNHAPWVRRPSALSAEVSISTFFSELRALKRI